MKALFFSLVISFFIVLQVKGQQNNWERLYGLSNRYEECYSVAQVYDHGYLYAISVYSASDNKYFSWLLKTDINGNPVWSKYFIDPYYWFSGLIVNTDTLGDIVVTGQTFQADPSGDVLILRLNSCGEKLWCKYLHFPEGNFGWRVKQIANGNYALYTCYASNDWTIEGNQLWRLDSSGNILSCAQLVPSYSYPYLDDPLMNDVLVTQDQGFLIMGHGWIQDTASPQQWWRLQHVLIKTDSLGNEQWMHPDSLNLERAGALGAAIQLNDTFYIEGYTKDLIPKWYPYFAKVTAFGDILNETKLHSDTLYTALTGINEANGDFFHLGQCCYTGSDPVFTGIFHTDINGNLIKCLENKHGFPSKNAFVKSIDNKFLAAGYAPYDYTSALQLDAWAMKVNEDMEYDSLYTFPFVYDSLCPFPITTDTVDCDCDLITGYGEPLRVEDRYELKVYPNPAGEVIRISFLDRAGDLERTNKEIILFDLMGKPALKAIIGKEAVLNVSRLPDGVYVAVVLNDGQVLAREKVVIIH